MTPRFRSSPPSTATLQPATVDITPENHVDLSVVNQKTPYRTLGTDLPPYFRSGHPPVVDGKNVCEGLPDLRIR